MPSTALPEIKKRTALILACCLLFAALAAVFAVSLRAPGSVDNGLFVIEKGEGIAEISGHLVAAGHIRSRISFVLYGLATGNAFSIKPGRYKFSQKMTVGQLYTVLLAGPHRQVQARIIPGDSMYEIAQTLDELGVVPQNEFLSYAKENKLEGRLFPDTYFFFTDSSAPAVAQVILENFSAKTAQVIPEGTSDAAARRLLTIASLLEREVKTGADQRLVAGIIEKRLKAGMPLQIDATICYIKKIASFPPVHSCYPLDRLDFRAQSDYNTYLYKGLPPGPIGNPGLASIQSAQSPQNSPYWFYISDPKTDKTIFARDLGEQNENRSKYLGL